MEVVPLAATTATGAHAIPAKKLNSDRREMVILAFLCYVIRMQRRSFLIGLGSSLIAAPAVVRASSLMPIRAIDDFRVFPGSTHPLTGLPRISWRRLYFDSRDYCPVSYSGHEMFTIA
jgi:hypothetical protein